MTTDEFFFYSIFLFNQMTNHQVKWKMNQINFPVPDLVAMSILNGSTKWIKYQARQTIAQFADIPQPPICRDNCLRMLRIKNASHSPTPSTSSATPHIITKVQKPSALWIRTSLNSCEKQKSETEKPSTSLVATPKRNNSEKRI